MLDSLLALAPLALPQTTWFVDDDAAGPGTGTSQDPYASIQVAIDASTTVDGDEIRVVAGVYQEELLIDGKQLRLRGDSAQGPVQVVKANAGVRGVVIRNVAAPGVRLSGFEFIQTISALDGGGIEIDGSAVSITGCFISDHVVRTFQNESKGAGILAINGSVVRVTDSTISSCTTPVDGGGVSVSSSSVGMTDCVIERCGMFGQPFFGAPRPLMGGGAFLESGALQLRGCTVEGNAASAGGGISVASGLCSLQDCTIQDNGAPDLTDQGGGLRGIASVERCTFSGNAGQLGGGAFGASSFTDCRFSNNIGAGGNAYAPAVWGGASGVRASLTRCTVEDHFGGTRAAPGAALYQCDLTDCVVKNNRCVNEFTSDEMAGGLTDGSATGTLFENNLATANLGGAFEVKGGAVSNATLHRCILIGNRAVNASAQSSGGAAHLSTLVNCTLIGNAADGTGGAASESTLTSCIAWSNGPMPLVASTSVSWSNVEGGAAGTGNISADPQLFGLFASDLLRPQAGSPCIDAGDPASQDPDGSRVDIGALPFDGQFAPLPSPYCRSFVGFPITCEPTLGATANPSLSSGWSLHVEGIPANTFTVGLVGSGYRIPAESFPGSFTDTLCLGGALRQSAPVRSMGTGDCGGAATLIISPAALQGAGAVVGQSMFGQVLFRTNEPSAPFGVTAGLEAFVLL